MLCIARTERMKPTHQQLMLRYGTICQYHMHLSTAMTSFSQSYRHTVAYITAFRTCGDTEPCLPHKVRLHLCYIQV